MKAFHNYLLNKHLAAEKSAPYYVSWVTKAYAFSDKDLDTPLSPGELDMFLRHLARSYEDWQVKQAKEAITLYGYFLRTRETNANERTADEDVLWKQAIDTMVSVMRLKHLALKTEQAYMGWVRSFFVFLKGKSPDKLDNEDLKAFINHLSVDRKAAHSTQNQAFNALLFFYRHALDKDPGDLGLILRAKNKRRLPVVLSQGEVLRLFDQMQGVTKLMARLIYGSGIRLNECVRLRVKDVDFERSCLIVRAGKGDKDRQTLLPERLKEDLLAHLDKVRKIYEADLQDETLSGVYLPDALERKYPNAGKEWGWQWLFPSRSISVDPRSRKVRRHHIHSNTLQRQIKQAAQKAGLSKQVSVHTLRHSFATHLLEKGYDIRTIQKLLGHASVRSTMIYTHVAQKNRLDVRSPLDG